MTPRQFHALSARHKDAQERVELLMGINTSVLANHSFNPPKKAYKPIDFMPSKWAEKEAERQSKKPKRFSRKRFADELRATFRAMAATNPHMVRLVEPKAEQEAP